MSEENKRLARRALEEIYSKGDLEVVDELVHPEFADHEPEHPDLPIGPDAVRQTVKRLHETFSDLRFEVHQEVAEGDLVVQQVTMSGRHTGPMMGRPPTGRGVRRQARLHLARGRRPARRALGQPRRRRAAHAARTVPGLVLAQAVERALEALVELDLGLPAELFTRARGVERDVLHLAGALGGVLEPRSRRARSAFSTSTMSSTDFSWPRPMLIGPVASASAARRFASTTSST